MANATMLEVAVKSLMDYYSGLGKGTRVGNVTGTKDKFAADYVEDTIEKLEEPLTFRLYSDTGDCLTMSDLSKVIVKMPKVLGGMRIRYTFEDDLGPTCFGFAPDQIAKAPDVYAEILFPGIRNIISATAKNTINTSLGSATFGKPNLGAIFIQDSTYGPRFANIQAAVMLLNYMPSLEMSRCMPYLRIFQIFPTPAISKAGNIMGPSILKFLGIAGFDPVDKLFSPGAAIAAARPNVINDSQSNRPAVAGDYGGIVGMEMFLSPQMMQNINTTTVAPGSAVGNKKTEMLAPLMTIRSFTMTESWLGDTGAMTSFDTSLQVVLHDRAQLANIRDLVEYGRYNTIRWAFEMGWSHPGDNVWGNMLNAGRLIFLGQTEDSSYSLSQEGGMVIDIKFKAIPQDKVKDCYFFEGFGVTFYKFARNLKMMQRSLVNDAEVAAGSKGNPQIGITREGPPTPETRIISQAIMSAITDQLTKKTPDPLPIPDIDPIQIAVTLGILKADNEMLAISSDNDPVTGMPLLTVADAIKSTKAALSSGIDPYLQKINIAVNGKIVEKDFRPSPAGSSISSKDVKYVSFAKAALIIMGSPMAATGVGDEIQFFFCPVNMQAGAAAQCNIGNLPIPIETLNQILDDSMDSKLNASPLSVHIMRDICKKILGSNKYIVYGTPEGDHTIPPLPDPATGEMKVYPDLVAASGGVMNEKFGNIGTSAEVRKPIITYRCEQTVQVKAGKTVQISRLIWYDTLAGPYQLEKEMLTLTAGDSISGVSDVKDKGTGAAVKAVVQENDGNTDNANVEKSFKRWAGGVIKFITKAPSGHDQIDPGADYRKWKASMKGFIPSITYGAAGSTITNLSSNAIQSRGQQAVIEYRAATVSVDAKDAIEGSESATPNTTPESIEAQVIPMSINMTCVGNPFIRTGQEYYIDMQTGTALDTIYMVDSVKHTITQGSFLTTVALVNKNPAGMAIMSDDIGNIVSQLMRSVAKVAYGTAG